MYKLILRTDDIGYSKVHDMGAFETYDHGYATYAEVMLDAPNIVDSLKRLREMPWVSVGWHTHFWHSPVLDPAEVPSLVIPGTNRFKHYIQDLEDIEYSEILKEMRAEMDLCVDVLGRAPDVGMIVKDDIPMGMTDQELNKEETPFNRAMAQVVEEYGMASGFSRRFQKNDDGTMMFSTVDPKWENTKVYLAGLNVVSSPMYDSIAELDEKYDPIQWLLEDQLNLNQFPDGAAIMHGFHPAYVDQQVNFDGDYMQFKRFFTLSRVYDVEALCSKRLHDWIKENQIELCSVTDALYGTHHYQNHLRSIGSDLCVY